ncbi:hypothetical protein IMPR6_90113 [Imperialibacter sp. EC-SDR9]|nr:hypothetical protein IMPERIA75_370077 [Imperialibacter sp. 75]CAD5298532.1 hypothetical protein IMPERIA89_740029 [Imperialibacter sp. 89]VVT35644.1 hypothetical protein IMPR6_90113 [Imperialibacter sp. EC-SDR9]
MAAPKTSSYAFYPIYRKFNPLNIPNAYYAQTFCYSAISSPIFSAAYQLHSKRTSAGHQMGQSHPQFRRA